MYDDNEQSGDEEEIGADPSTTAELTWSVHRTPDGWRGVVRVPLDAGRCLTVKRTAKSEKGAAESALASASKVLDSPAARALIPPQARLALAIARSPKLRSVAKSVLKLF